MRQKIIKKTGAQEHTQYERIIYHEYDWLKILHAIKLKDFKRYEFVVVVPVQSVQGSIGIGGLYCRSSIYSVIWIRSTSKCFLRKTDSNSLNECQNSRHKTPFIHVKMAWKQCTRKRFNWATVIIEAHTKLQHPKCGPIDR